MNNKKTSTADKLKFANEIKKLYSQGLLVTQIQEKLNLSNKLYYTICNEYNISSPNKILPFAPSIQMIERIKELFNQKHSASEVARKLNITEKILERVIKKNNIQKPILASEDPNIINSVKELYNNGNTIAGISRELSISKSAIRQIYKELNFNSKNNLKRGQSPIPTEKQCKNLNCTIKPISDFFKTIRKGNLIHYSSYCIKCANEITRTNNRKNWRNHKRDKNKFNSQRRKKWATDFEFRLRSRISAEIRRALKNNCSSKAGQSFLKYVDYTMSQLKTYIESKFLEPGNEWMNWENWGIYKPETWDDDDKSTWKWQLDHIKPHSDFPYTSMEDENFKKAWAMKNLRPYSAKQNIIDGTTKIRHNKT